MRKTLTLSLLVLISILAFLLPSIIVHSSQSTLEKAIACRVKDGDTIDVYIPNRGYETIRYTGINTPETDDSEPFSKEARKFNSNLVNDKTVWLEYDKERRGPCFGSFYDKSGNRKRRVLAYVYLSNRKNISNMVNAILVVMGYAEATPYEPNIKYKEVFADLEKKAKELGLGQWKD